MTLPPVSGWVLDFRTARAIFDSKNNANIDAIHSLVVKNKILICHREEHLFKGHSQLAQTFLDGSNCICRPDDALMKKCATVGSNPLCKKIFPQDGSTIWITAIAIKSGFGVLSDHRSISFTTSFDLCKHYGVPALTAKEFFAAI